MTDETEYETVTVQIPSKPRQSYNPSFRFSEERSHISLPDGPTVAFTYGSVRIIDSGYDEYVEIESGELARILVDLFLDEANTQDESQP